MSHARDRVQRETSKGPQVDLDGNMTSLFDAFEDLDAPAALNLAQKLGGDPFEAPPKFSTNQAFLFIKPHANNLSTRTLVQTTLRERGIAVVAEGEIDAVTILSRKLIGVLSTSAPTARHETKRARRRAAATPHARAGGCLRSPSPRVP